MNNDIRKLIDDNWEDIKELIAQKTEAEQKPKSIWDLKTKDEEEYYRLYHNGAIVLCAFSSSIDRLFRYLGNAFLTKEEAEFMKERRRIEAVMMAHSRPFKKGENNYCLYFHDCKSICVGTMLAFNIGIPCFESEEIAQQVIDKIGKDRLEKYWFRVEE